MLTSTSSGTLSAAARPLLIEDSWSRSRKFGLRAHELPDFAGIGKSDLQLLHEQNQTLMRHATPVMETLHAQIIDTESMIVLTDASGLVLHSLGDDSFSLRAAHIGLRPGVNWSEQQKGTNAVGTAIFEELPTVVHGSQHFLEANQFLTCSAAPIFAPAGDLVGVLDVSGDYRGYHRHTMGLVRMSAQMIENALFQRTYTGQLTVAFHSRPEFIGTLMEGLIAFASDGRVLSANRSACLQFELSRSTLTTHTALSLLGRSASELTAATATAVSTPLPCVVPSGVRVYAVPTAQAARRFTGFSAEPFASARDASSDEPSNRSTTGEASRAFASTTAENVGQAQYLEADSYPFATLDYLDSGDARVKSVVERLRRVAGSPVSILIEAETGAGKEWFSRAIHRASRRADAPFIAVNCAAIPDGLIESELFGYEDGAFTGARRKGHRGKIAQADGGTLFLDEIGDMPIAMQARLLRVLQDRVVTPLGGSKSIPVDIRLICATHHRLRDLIAAKAFRDDLYYRLNGLTVRVPPLRERTDVRELVLRMHAALSGAKAGLSADVLMLMLNHRWPGNLRQLNNVLSTARAIAGPDAEICREHLPDDFLDDVCEDAANHHRADAMPSPPASASAAVAERSTSSLSSLDNVALTAIRRALDRHRGNVSAAARELGVSRNTLYRRLSQNKIQP